jgi:hypothetical protein
MMTWATVTTKGNRKKLKGGYMRDCLAAIQGEHTNVFTQLGIEDNQEEPFDF